MIRGLVVLAAVLGGCGGPPAMGFDRALAATVLRDYSALLYQGYVESAQGAVRLRDEVSAFVLAPSAGGLESCRKTWVAGRPAYVQTEIARFSMGPIDRSPDGPEKYLNAWPVDESYIEALLRDPSRLPVIDAKSLRAANEKGGERNISTGWHAIEYLLWGKDESPGPGGGTRPVADFADGAPEGARRRAWLLACAELLVQDLEWVRDQWDPGRTENYRAFFLSRSLEEGLSRLMTGMATLAVGELYGERLVVPFTTKDKEDEHSCFSDTTHLDHVNDAIGVRNVWEEAGLRRLAETVNPRLAGEVTAALEATIAALRNPVLNPFDQAILGDDARPGRRAIQEALDGLTRFNEAFSRLAARLGVNVRTGPVR